MFTIQVVDFKVEFSKWWVAEFKTIKYPSQGTVFDYFIDTETKEFLPWSHIIPKFELDSDMPLQVLNTYWRTKVDFKFLNYFVFRMR